MAGHVWFDFVSVDAPIVQKPRKVLITGSWEITANEKIAEWTTSDGRTNGFFVANLGSTGEIFVDTNQNGKFNPRRDGKIGTFAQFAIGQRLSKFGGGTWDLDLDEGPGFIRNLSSDKVAIAFFNNTSIF